MNTNQQINVKSLSHEQKQALSEILAQVLIDKLDTVKAMELTDRVLAN